MTNINHESETLDNGTVRHTYSGGPFAMTVFDRRESKNSEPSHVNLRTAAGAMVAATAYPGLDPGEPDYLIETRTSSRDCDLEILIEDATIARDVLHDFREILLNDHEITTTLNGK
ncbi:hypothetical protein ACYB2S_13845 [Corynebacterium variabile]|uniref:hypothetical protein n=1 Tax=Corynebacterium variabile TaxID=1727 RepID=UPI003C8EBC88